MPRQAVKSLMVLVTPPSTPPTGNVILLPIIRLFWHFKNNVQCIKTLYIVPIEFDRLPTGKARGAASCNSDLGEGGRAVDESRNTERDTVDLLCCFGESGPAHKMGVITFKLVSALGLLTKNILMRS